MGLFDKFKKNNLEEKNEYKQYLEILKELAKNGVNISNMENIEFYQKMKKEYKKYEKPNDNNNLSFIEWFESFSLYWDFRNYCIEIAKKMNFTNEKMVSILESRLSEITLTDFIEMLKSKNLNEIKRDINLYIKYFNENQTKKFTDYDDLMKEFEHFHSDESSDLLNNSKKR